MQLFFYFTFFKAADIAMLYIILNNGIILSVFILAKMAALLWRAHAILN